MKMKYKLKSNFYNEINMKTKISVGTKIIRN